MTAVGDCWTLFFLNSYIHSDFIFKFVSLYKNMNIAVLNFRLFAS